VVDSNIYVIGGGFSPQLVDIYHPETDTWAAGVDLLTPRAALTTSAVDGVIYAIGGGDAMNIVPHPKGPVEAFDTGFREPKSVNAAGKLSTIWGKIKQD
jgi:hypothetical protein